MKPITIGQNISALTVQRGLAKAESSLSQVYTRLSSGMRINNASDDAAGLAIAMSLNTDSRVFNQARRNLNDGINLLSIADGALSNLTDIVTRLSELAEQSANGTFSTAQRKALDQEAQQLSKEYSRIITSTKFNGLNVLRGEGANVSLQAGYGVDGILNGSVGGAVGNGSYNNTIYTQTGTTSIGGTAIGDINGDGIDDVIAIGRDGVPNGAITVSLGNGDGTFRMVASYSTASTQFYGGDVTLADINNDGRLDILATGSIDSADGRLITLLGDGAGGFSNMTQYVTEDRQSRSIATADIN